jgi:hypothetical protein
MISIFDPVVKQILELLTQQVDASNMTDPAYKVLVNIKPEEKRWHTLTFARLLFL